MLIGMPHGPGISRRAPLPPAPPRAPACQGGPPSTPTRVWSKTPSGARRASSSTSGPARASRAAWQWWRLWSWWRSPPPRGRRRSTTAARCPGAKAPRRWGLALPFPALCPAALRGFGASRLHAAWEEASKVPVVPGRTRPASIVEQQGGPGRRSRATEPHELRVCAELHRGLETPLAAAPGSFPLVTSDRIVK